MTGDSEADSALQCEVWVDTRRYCVTVQALEALILARQLAHQIIIKAEGEAQQTLVRNQAAPVTFQLGRFWVSEDRNSSAMFSCCRQMLRSSNTGSKHVTQCISVLSVSLRACWALGPGRHGGTVQVLAEGYSKALNFFSSGGQENDACDVNFSSE